MVTVDVEGAQRARRYRSVELLADLVADIGVETTLFVTPDVVENETDVVRSWLEDGHAIGLHVHPERFDRFDSPWLTEYSRESIEWMLQRGKSTFKTYLGHDPDIFRAGRWEFSETLLEALNDQGFVRDASLSPAQRDTERDSKAYATPSLYHGVEEFPITTYDSPLLRPLLWPVSIDCVPLDLSTFLTRRVFLPGFYLLTLRKLRSTSPYTMVVFHDFDLTNESMYGRVRDYLSFLKERGKPTTLRDV